MAAAGLAGFFFATLLLSFTSASSSSTKHFASAAFWALFWCSSCGREKELQLQEPSTTGWGDTAGPGGGFGRALGSGSRHRHVFLRLLQHFATLQLFAAVPPASTPAET